MDKFDEKDLSKDDKWDLPILKPITDEIIDRAIRAQDEDDKKIKRFTTTVEYDAEKNDYFITLPKELLVQLDWKPGDMLQYTLLDNNSCTIKKVDPTYEPTVTP